MHSCPDLENLRTKMNGINYQNLEDASKKYSNRGYNRIEVPWWVTTDIANITKPTGVPESSNYVLSVNKKCLVASGEQSFLYLANKGYIPNGKYHAITPCFRNESYDAYHSKQFMKLELIELHDVHTELTQEHITGVVNDALEVLRSIAPFPMSDCIFSMETGTIDPITPSGLKQIDICLQLNGEDVELGSYGIRKTSFAQWIYGTGIAEPRFSKAINAW